MTDTASVLTVFDPTVALTELLADVGLCVADAGGAVTFAGQDPIIAGRHRLGAAIGIPMMGNAVAAAAMHRHRGSPGQDLHLDLRQEVHHINPSFAWKPTLAVEFPSIALVLSAQDAVFEPLLAKHPGLTVIDTRVALRAVRSWRRLLGPDGRAQEIVPVDLWASVC